jgi:branched-chain amino acid transport system permease protein
MSHKTKSLLFLAALLAVLSVLPLILSTYYLGVVTSALILAILAMSANLLLGYVGLASVGQAAFFGVASYAVAIYTRSVEGAAWSAVAIGLLAALAAGLVFGPLAIRTRDIFFLVIMLAFCQILYGVTYGWRSVTGGDDGLPGLGRPDLIPGVSLESPVSYYVFVVVVFLLVTAGFRLFVNSPFGLALKGIRDSESRMRALGYNVWLYKYIAFVASALLGGVSGILHAYYYGCPNPADFSLIHSSSALLMVILGGPGTLFGPLAGSLIIVFVREFVSSVTDRWLIVLGLAYVCTVLFFPNGLIGTITMVMGKKSSEDPTQSEKSQPELSNRGSTVDLVSSGRSE